MSRDGRCYRWQTIRPRESQCRSRRGGMGQPRENLETCFGGDDPVGKMWAGRAARDGYSEGKQGRSKETGNGTRTND